MQAGAKATRTAQKKGTQKGNPPTGAAGGVRVDPVILNTMPEEGIGGGGRGQRCSNSPMFS